MRQGTGLGHNSPGPYGLSLSLTCVAVQDLAVGCCQLKHFQLGAVGGHNNVRVTRAQELHIQNLLVVSCELQWEQPRRAKAAGGEGGNDWFSFHTGCHFYIQQLFLAKSVLPPCSCAGLWATFPQTMEFSGTMEQWLEPRTPLGKALPAAELILEQGKREKEAEGCHLLPELQGLSIVEDDVVLHGHGEELIPGRDKLALGEAALAGLLLQREGHSLGVHTGSCGHLPHPQDAWKNRRSHGRATALHSACPRIIIQSILGKATQLQARLGRIHFKVLLLQWKSNSLSLRTEINVIEC